MFFIFAFALAGTSVLLLDYLAVLIALGIPIGLVLAAVLWFNDHTGINNLIISSWVWLSGYHLGDSPLTCTSGAQQDDTASASFAIHILLLVVLLVVSLVNVAVGLTAVVGIPVGVVGSLIGGVVSAVSRSTEAIRFGLKALTLGLGAMIAFGVLLRIMRVVFEAAMC